MGPSRAKFLRSQLGSVVGVRLGPLLVPQHVGILAPHPQWNFSVISFGPEGIIEEPVWQFADGRPFDSVSYPSMLPWQVVVRRAREAFAVRPYDAIDFNCDYLVQYCHGLPLESPQVKTITFVAVLGLGLALAAAA